MKLLIISGRSGSGKSTVLHILEDRGYYCIDNLPASLLPALAQRLSNESNNVDNIAVSIDARNIYTDLQQVPEIVNQLEEMSIQPQVIFLDANSKTLLQRFSESRRKHPLSSKELGLQEAINKESELLESLSLMATLNIDTSNMSLHQLRDRIKSRILNTQEDAGLALLFQSFGFKSGVPIDADIVYDVRCLPNPYWDTSLRALTGKDNAVIHFLDKQEQVQAMYSDIKAYLEKWLPCFEDNNRSYITVAIGCTGGQHRSVYLCDKLGTAFTSDSHNDSGKPLHFGNVQVRHREIGDWVS